MRDRRSRHGEAEHLPALELGGEIAGVGGLLFTAVFVFGCFRRTAYLGELDVPDDLVSFVMAYSLIAVLACESLSPIAPALARCIESGQDRTIKSAHSSGLPYSRRGRWSVVGRWPLRPG